MSTITVEKILFLPGSGGSFLNETRTPSRPLQDRYLLQTPAHRFTGGPILSLGLKAPGEEEIFWGDCIPSPAGALPEWTNRDEWEAAKQQIQSTLKGKEFSTYRQTREALTGLPWSSVRFAMSQALLALVARHHGRSQWEVLAREWELAPKRKALPVHGSAAREGDHGLEGFLHARSPSLPAGNETDVPGNERGLIETVKQLRSRVAALEDDTYRPVFHFDFHGGLGDQFGEDFNGLCQYLLEVEEACKPYPLRVEGPFLARDLLNQIHLFGRLREVLESKGARLELVADEWAHSLEDIRQWLSHGAAHGIHIKLPSLGSVHDACDALRLCQGAETLTFLGGNQTESSARTGVHVGLALEPDFLVLEPSQTFPDPLRWVGEEIQRITGNPADPEDLSAKIRALAKTVEASKNDE